MILYDIICIYYVYIICDVYVMYMSMGYSHTLCLLCLFGYMMDFSG